MGGLGPVDSYCSDVTILTARSYFEIWADNTVKGGVIQEHIRKVEEVMEVDAFPGESFLISILVG